MSSSLYGVEGGCEFRFFFPHGKNTFFIRFQLLLWAIIYSKQNYTSKEIPANHLSNPVISFIVGEGLTFAKRIVDLLFRQYSLEGCKSILNPNRLFAVFSTVLLLPFSCLDCH